MRERRLRVQESLLLDPVRPVRDDSGARMDVARAGRDVDDRVVRERVRGVVELEDALAGETWVVRGIDAIVEPDAARSAGRLVEAAAASLEEDEELLGIAPADPERVRAAAGASRLSTGRDALPAAERDVLGSSARTAGEDGERENEREQSLLQENLRDGIALLDAHRDARLG